MKERRQHLPPNKGCALKVLLSRHWQPQIFILSVWQHCERGSQQKNTFFCKIISSLLFNQKQPLSNPPDSIISSYNTFHSKLDRKKQNKTPQTIRDLSFHCYKRKQKTKNKTISNSGLVRINLYFTTLDVNNFSANICCSPPAAALASQPSLTPVSLHFDGGFRINFNKTGCWLLEQQREEPKSFWWVLFCLFSCVLMKCVLRWLNNCVCKLSLVDLARVIKEAFWLNKKKRNK